MSSPVYIGIDVMGGDYFPEAPIEGALLAKDHMPDGSAIVLVGNETIIQNYFKQRGMKNPFKILPAPQYITMDENPAKAVKAKPQSSIHIGLKALKEGKLKGFVSAGNTGAVVVASVLILEPIEGVLRPTIGLIYPEMLGNRKFLLCDVGANIDCKPEILAHFACLGSIFMKTIYGIERPSVALLNIGEEEGKGNQQTKQAYQLLKQMKNIHFIGNIEGRDLNHNPADVVVCDGFIGNIILKYGESFYSVLKSRLDASDPFLQKFNFSRVGGLPLIGVNGNVLIGHGISGPEAFKNMLISAATYHQLGLLQAIRNQIHQFNRSS